MGKMKAIAQEQFERDYQPAPEADKIFASRAEKRRYEYLQAEVER